MKTKVTMQAIGLSIKDNTGKDNNHFYQISIDQDGEAGSLSMTEDAYMSIHDTFKKYHPYAFSLEYNDQYKSMRVIGIKAL